MISVLGKKWIKKKVNKNLVEKIKQDFKLDEISSRLVVSRSYDNTEINLINNELKIINVFKNNNDFKKATDLLIKIINKRKNICILGDYDVDGSAATSLFVNFFNHIKNPYYYYIPDREKDGYGTSKELFQKLILKKPDLVIMVDCGSTSQNAIDFLNHNNIKSIIIDHHEIYRPFPKSNVIINPKKNNGYMEYDYFCATALTYFFLDILVKKINSTFKLDKFLIYVVLATICDVMPLRKVNKIIASNVIKKFDVSKNIIINNLFKSLNIKKKLSSDDLGYLIGPIINSGGRLNFSRYATELLTSKNLKIIEKKLNKLVKLNEKRKKLEQNIINEIDFQKISDENKNIIIYYDSNINEGLIGIIAARLKDFFNKPTIVITKSGNFFKASARSTKNYNIGKFIKILLDKNIIEKGGGHNMAAGFVIKKENIKILDTLIQKDYLNKNFGIEFLHNYDFEISPSAINSKLTDYIDKLGPFGNENPVPLFLIKDLKIIKRNVINGKHISVILKPNIGSSIKSIFFNCMNSQISNFLLSYQKKINVIAEIHQNIWNNKKNIQLSLKDILIKVN